MGVWRTFLISLCGLAAAAAAQPNAAMAAEPTETLALNVNAGELVRLPSPAAKVFVADPEIADFQVASNRSLLVFGRKPGRTTLYALSETDGVILSRRIAVAFDVGQLQALIEAELPRSNIVVRSTPAGIVLGGRVETSIEAETAQRIAAGFAGTPEAVVNQLAVTSPTQVNIRVRVVEMSREITRRFGFNWEALFDVGGSTLLGIATGRDLNLAGGPRFPRDPASLNTGGGSLVGGFNRGGADVSGMIDALAQENLVTVLAEPNLTSLSGETASFIAGGEFPIPVAQSDDKISIQFKQFGVVLDFTPTVLSPGRISMRVRPEVSELTEEGAITTASIVIPAITLRRTETTIEVASGQSFAIAGLLQDSTRSKVSKFPGLGDVPVLGTLFRSEDFLRNETELVIIATAYLVQPTSRGEYADPIAGFEPPSDLERILSGKVARVSGNAPTDLAQPGGLRLVGEAGFYY